MKAFATVLPLITRLASAYDNGKCGDVPDINAVYVDWYDNEDCNGDPVGTYTLKPGKCITTGYKGPRYTLRSELDYEVDIYPSFGHDCNQVSAQCWNGGSSLKVLRDHETKDCQRATDKCSNSQCHYFLNSFWWDWGDCNLGKPTPPFGDHCDLEGKANNECCEVDQPDY